LQTYKNIEIILIDDDSPDNCPQLCDNYAKQYNNINVIHLKDSGIGVSGARNAGLDNTSGEFVAFVDSDDFVHINIFFVKVNACIFYKMYIICALILSQQEKISR
jgi:glycosyltransferase involved in cell wall biosynthesis